MLCFIIFRSVRAGDLLHILLRLLKKSFGERSVLDIDSGEIKHGSRTAVIGPNGAGKSTLLNIMAGILKPTCGNIYYDGSKEFPGTNISLVFQEPYLISSTVEKNIAYPLKIRGFSKEDIDEYMQLILSGENDEECLKILSQKRKKTLDKIHILEKQISNLDYLKNEIKNNN